MTSREGMPRQKGSSRIQPWRCHMKKAEARVCKRSGTAIGARYGKRPIAVLTGALGVLAWLWGAAVAGRQIDAADEVAATIHPEAFRADMRFRQSSRKRSAGDFSRPGITSLKTTGTLERIEPNPKPPVFASSSEVADGSRGSHFCAPGGKLSSLARLKML